MNSVQSWDGTTNQLGPAVSCRVASLSLMSFTFPARTGTLAVPWGSTWSMDTDCGKLSNLFLHAIQKRSRKALKMAVFQEKWQTWPIWSASLVFNSKNRSSQGDCIFLYIFILLLYICTCWLCDYIPCQNVDVPLYFGISRAGHSCSVSLGEKTAHRVHQ